MIVNILFAHKVLGFELVAREVEKARVPNRSCIEKSCEKGRKREREALKKAINHR